jgi:PEP-CTERM motif
LTSSAIENTSGLQGITLAPVSTAIPEPSALALLGAALAGLFLFRFRANRRNRRVRADLADGGTALSI